MGKSVWRSIEYFFTGNYTADDGNNDIDAYGLGGVIHAYGGDDTIRVGSIGATVYTGTGNDSVYGGAAYLKVVDDSGNLTVKGAAGYADISKSQSGNVHFAGASGATNIDHQGRDGDIRYQGAALANFLTRKGISGNVSFEGAGGYNKLWHQTDRGDLSYSGAGAANKLDRTWHSQYQGSQGNIHFSGAGAANIISSMVESGNVTLNGAGAYNKVFRKGREGDISFNGAGGWNELSRLRNEQDEYLQTCGDIRFNGAGGYNRLLSDVAEGNIHFKGAGGYNHLSRKGSDSDSSHFAGARADEIALTTATMGGSWINQSQAVTAIKSTLQPNTYLFAFFDGMYTKINRVELSNDGVNGALRYHATSWYKEGNHLDGLAGRQIDAGNGFVSTQTDGAYRLSDLVFERRQRIKLEAVEADLTENSWINYGGGVNVAAADVTLSSAKMSGYAIFEDGTKVDVNAVKSRAQANTYVFAKQLGPYTKIVVVELANDRETGALKYLAKAWYKEGNHLAGLADKVISEHTGFTAMGTGGYSLSEVRYQLDTVTAVSDRLPATREFSSQLLLPRQQSGGKSKGDIFFDGAGGGNVIESDVTEGNIHFNGAGAANVLIKRGQRGDLVFRGAGLANVLVHQGAQGRMDVYAAGAANVLVRSGDGEYLARLLAYGNISVQQGRGDSQVVMLGGYNTHTQLGDGRGLWLAGGGFNLLTQVGNGRLDALSVGGANVLTKLGAGQLTAGLLGGANVLTHVTQGDEAADTRAVLLGGANVLTRKGNGKVQAILGGGANVLTQIGQGDTQALLLGAANVLTRVGDGDLSAVMLGGANVLTHVGNGDTLGVMGAAGNLFTKVGDGTAIAAMIGAGNLFTQIGQGDAWALMGGVANVFTKVGDGNALALMVAKANVFTHIGDGLTVALMLAQGNLATKVGNGMTLAAMVGNANVFTHVGAGETFAAMLGQANLFTKVGDGLTAALMIGKANVYSHIGNGTSLGLFAGELNVMTKVGNGTTLAALFGKANIVTHVGGGLTGVLALGKANIITKVGDDFLGAIAKADANVLTHVGNGTTAGVLWGKGNLLTKIGDGTTVGLLISEVGNVMTHVGAGSTIGLAKGRANLITKVGDGLVVQGAWGDVNLLTQVGNGDRYSFAKGRANVLTKVGDGREVAVLQGEANLVTQVGNGDGYTGAWGKANVITKVGDGRQVVLAKGDANIVTQVGEGDGYQALLGKANIVTRVGDGIQVTLAKGEINQTTTVGDGLSVTAAYGKFNNNVKVGDGTTINLAWGDYNLNTKVGDGLNVAVMKGKGNANIQIGDGLDITAAYARHNVAIKIGNGDFYSLAIASSNTSSNKLGTLFDNIKQTLLGSAGNQAINYLVQGDENGPIKTPQAASLGEVQGLSGFGLDEIGEVKSSLAGSLTGKVSQAGERDEQAMDKALQLDEQGLARGGENLIVNGDFERGAHGWQHAGAGIEADFSAATYGLAADGHGARVSELSTDRNTQISQDLAGLKAGETVNLTFDFARRANISLQHGIEVLWNGERVFASEGDASSWQSKALTLTAREGRNTLAFRGIGESNGLGYLLDNVVATASGKAEIGQVSAQLAQDDNAARARGDQASADADKQRLEQEKGQQLAAIAGTQAQLEATDQHKLAQNGQDQRAAIEAESREMTAQLDTLARRFEQVRASDAASEPSGQHWRTGFADRLLSTVQEDLDDAGNTAGTAIEEARSRHEAQHQQLDTALAKSKTGQQRSEQLQGDAEAAGQHRAAQAEQRRLDALARQGEATSRQQQGEASASQAQLAGEQAASQAGLQANQAKQNAASLKQSGDKPTRQGVQSDPSTAAGQPLLQTGELDVPAVGTLSAPDEVPPSAIDTATGLSEQEQSALDGALAAVNRLQINAGSRQPVARPIAPTPTPTPTPTEVQQEAQATATATKPVQQHEVLAKAAVDLTGLHGPRTGSKAVPEFSSHFDGSSIGIENELTGLVVALPKNSAQKFGYVHDAAGNPLFMLTKDMNQGGYTNPAGISDVKGINQWQTHTIELVTYPSEMQDQQAVEARKEAMLWLAREFTQHISQTNHTRLSDLVSEDGRFTLVISNANHVIAAGNGAARDGQGQTIGMTPSGQQATVAVSAKAFGSGSSQEIRLLESAPWYHPELKELLLSNTANVQWEDAATAQNVFAYLTSIYGKTADLAREYGIHINDWDPLAEGITPNAQGLTDPKVKNAWEILPRTKPVAMLALLSAHDRKLVSEQILATLKSAYSPALAQNIYDYFKFGGEVAGHGINNATTGDSKHPEPAILFEFRQVPNELSQFVPKSESTARVEVKTLDQFDPVSRRTIVAAVNNLVEQSADFDSWYQAYRERQGLPPVKNAKKVASANHKAEWVMANHAEAWSQLTAEHQAQDASGLQALGGQKQGDQSPGVANADTAPLELPVRGPAVAVPETAGFAFQLLKSGDNGFIDSTRRQLGKLSIDLPSERLKAVREAVVRVQQQPSETNLGLLEQSLTQWQTRDPKEFARRGEQVKALRFEAAFLLSHTFASRAKSAGVYGLALPPEQAARFEDQLVFDGIGRIIGVVGELSATDIAKVSELGIRSLTEINSRAERQAPRTEHDSLIAFAHQLNQFDTPQTRQLAAEIKSLWLSGDVRGPRTIALFETASKTLGDYPQLQVLAQSLLADAQRSKATGQYIDNLFGRRFDSEIAHGLVTAPSQAALDTSAQLGSKLVKEFDDWIQTLQLDEATRTQRIDKKMAAFAEAIKKDTRPWFSRVPSLTEFLAEPTFANFKQMMTRVDNGFDVIKVPFLAVKMATHPELGMDTANWKREGDRFYGSVITKARSTSTEVASAKDGLLQVDLPGRTTSDYGTGLHYQPGGDKYEDFLNGRSVADGRILTPGKETTFERNALDKGLSVVTGASGSTNIMVHLNNYLAAKDPAYSPSQAYLNTLAFLVFDGGHSVNESLTVYRALQESGDARKQVLESYTANYRDLVDLAGEDSKASVQAALDGAFGRTLEFYQQHAYTAQLDELVALGTPRKGDTLADGELSAGSGKSVSVANDGSAPLDKQPLNPLTRFLNDNLYGTRDERRQVGDITRQLLDHAVSKGEAEQVTLQGDAGRLSGYLHKGGGRPGTSQDGKPEVVLFLHGSGSSAEEQADAVRSHYQKQGVDMLAVNLRGYGASDGGPSEQGVYQDARTMFRYLVEERGVAPGKILIHGYSMGGPIAADLARYAAEQGKPVGGLLLDRPMPSMSKAITAHELPNPGGLVGALAKAVNGRFSVEKNLDGLPKITPIMLLTDNEGLGSEGEKLRAKLAVAGYQVSGEQTFYGHLASNRLMGQYAEQIVGGLLSRTPAALDGADQPVRNQRVEQWQRPEVVPGSEGGETRFTSQIIIQTEDDPVAAKAAASLAGKHPDRSLVVQLDADGNYRVVYGDPAQLAGNIRWQVVGHGRDEDGQNNSRLSGYSADELAGHLRRLGDRLQQEAGVTTKPSHISLVGCSLVSDDLQTGFARRFIQALDNEGIRTQVSARSSEVAVDQGGRKHTRDEADVWARKVAANKVVLTLDDAGEPVVHNERVRGGVAEGDIVLAKVGEGESRARGAIADNDETFVAPDKQRQPETASSQADNAVSYSGNIQVNVGDGEFTALNWGTTNLGVKVGTGGMKSLAFGDNNVMVHIGDGDSKHSVDIAGYRALEGAQLFVGQRNVSFNLGRSNDLIVMLEKSIPTPPLVNPFGGAARIAGALQQIAGDGAKPDWVASQWDQWTLAGANKFVADMAGLDQTSSVEYGSLTRLDSDHERSSRGLKSDLEATLNKEFNKRISGGGQGEQGPLSRADKLRQANEKLVFNFAVAGQGADIQVTTGNWNFVFGDNIQAILDTNLGSLFGLMTQEFTASGQAKTTFTFTPTDLPRQLQNRLLGRLAGVGADTTLADIFGVDYNARGQLVARDGAAIDAPALLQEMLGVIAEFGGDQLKSLTDPAKWLDQLKAGLDLGEDALSSFARSHGLQDEAPEEAKSGTVTVQQGNDAKPAALPAATEERAFGFNALSLPNLFATLFNRDKQAEVVALASNLKQNLTADLLNMKEQTFDFLRNSGHLQGDGDMHVSLGNYNFNWGGDGKDLGAYLGDNNNFWGGRGDDVFYATGTSNIFTGGAGQDTGIMMGRENMMFGGQGDDVAVLAGRVNRAFMGEGSDQAFIFGEEGIVEGGAGQDYLVTSGNYNQIDAGADQDFTVTIGHHNQIRLGEGDDFAMVFGNHNRLLAEHGNNQVKLMGYHATIRGGDGQDRLIADQIAKFSQLDGGAGDDLLVLGGYQNQFSGGTGVDSFVFSGAVIENLVQDIGKEDFIVFNDVSWRDLWFKRSGYDLQLLVNRHTDGTSEQGKFEQLGSATFSNYFADNRAQLVIGLGEQQADGERSYSALSHQAVDNLIQAMSSFAPEAGDMGLLNRLDSQANSLVQSAWGDVIQGKGRVA
ncbi:TPA: MARTX multifunctional-autoprocessing repeats-in-toxin holotoxin RtxA [Aeromonas hydrophila]|uniref:MARTX multifunctional-autoprocessing repeats-in-toxin holotoxin RtxA n=2 Tax=Aeromonas hydrophila TaxID=644 RepID=UPI000588CC9E|nr:MARTX multifunctional-autoprocessing repeats-in-toxin holotoxin RtxA [Aeromonas hydrophila]AJE37253.1 peptidase C80 [Aeromonas hydrophila J-1]ANS00918.1 peptidase C80 [Aeromonas hydrophila]MCO4222441.1 MARTX multifunctional-autoprocessing repeats-in-toxin holotoxin RtxA [Aeromonas hydrophila]OSO92411.1 RTX toxin RtxA [Aeromonas hydrophila]UUT49260.1 MARTX multifunctional-autoprocessing repeats-in-toxin holotoxin RtxA [Aeromonas hydrophila]